MRCGCLGTFVYHVDSGLLDIRNGYEVDDLDTVSPCVGRRRRTRHDEFGRAVSVMYEYCGG